MRVYFDTSALVPAYVPEALTPSVVARLESATAVYVSWLTHVEICSALALKTRTARLEKGDARRVLDAFEQHLKARLYEVLPVSHEVYSLATTWLGSFDTSLRALDALHLACCQLFDLTLVTADGGLAEAAEHYGVAYEHLVSR